MILPDKVTGTYIEALTAVKNCVKPTDDYVSKPLNPVFALTDFELAMQNALTHCFSNIQLKGCFFHLKQAVQHWVSRKGFKKEMASNSEFRIWVNMLSSLALVPLSLFDQPYSIVENFKVVTKYDRKPIINYFKKTWVLGNFPPTMWNYFDFIGRKTNNDVEGFNRWLNCYLNSAHPTIFKFIDHLKVIESQVVLRLTDFKRNPLDFSQYHKPKKEVKAEFLFERLKINLTTGLMSLNDYLYAVASHLPVIDYIPEWLAVDEEGDDLECLNNAVIDVSFNSIEEVDDLSEEDRAILLAQELESELTNWENS